MTREASRNETTVLLVDDDESVRRVLERMISSLGFRVRPAHGAEEALSLAAAEPVQVLVCDIALPRLNGYELARRLASRSPELGVLFISGYSTEAIRDRYGQVADAPHLAKPFSFETLAEAIAHLVESRRALAA